jgi:hypothetical protein
MTRQAVQHSRLPLPGTCEWLELRGRAVEYDVEPTAPRGTDARLVGTSGRSGSGGGRRVAVPIGWQGRGCHRSGRIVHALARAPSRFAAWSRHGFRRWLPTGRLTRWQAGCSTGTRREIRLEGARERVDAFLRELRSGGRVNITNIAVALAGRADSKFEIRASRAASTAAPDLARPPSAPVLPTASSGWRFLLYIAAPTVARYSIVTYVPYDRGSTTMAAWTMDPPCDREYHDPRPSVPCAAQRVRPAGRA